MSIERALRARQRGFIINPFRFAGGGGGGTATWSPTDKTAGWSLSGGNLTATENTANNENIRATQGISDGQLVYFEVLCVNVTSGSCAVGLRISTDSINNNIGTGTHIAARTNGGIFVGGGCVQNSTQSITYANGDVFGFAVNRSSQRVWVYKNGAIFSGDPVAGGGQQFTLTSGGIFLPYAWADNNGTNNSLTLRAASSSWAYSAPTGYGALP